jgi:low affinity Fe/Cu permease
MGMGMGIDIAILIWGVPVYPFGERDILIVKLCIAVILILLFIGTFF